MRLSHAPHTFRCPVAPEVVQLCDAPYRLMDEFKYAFYTPVLCGPEELAAEENCYTLRQRMMRRRTEILIAITMYNESDEHLIRTLVAVFRNIRYFCELNKQFRRPNNPSHNSPESCPVGVTPDMNFAGSSQGSQPQHLEEGLRGEQIWTEDGWQKIVAAMGLFQDDVIMTERIDPLHDPVTGKLKPVTAHLFEYSCQAIVENDLSLRHGSRQGVVPVQMLFCLKEKNMKKLNSHKWLFRGIAPLLNPYICVLIDVGTRPTTPDALFRLWKGACGEISVMMGKGCTRLKNTLHPLVASQNFEYKLSNILDKTLESCFGYISVLPGAFSAYRWQALQDTAVDEGPLVAYFKGETPNPKGNVFASNMYLAEDRILCFELVAKRNSNWTLHHCMDAVAETDCPSAVDEFISQRRRWLNGTFFCQMFAIVHLGRLWTTKHGLFKKLALMVQFVYYSVNLVFGWFALGNFYLSFYLLSQQSLVSSDTDPNSIKVFLFDALRLSYIGVIMAQFICSLGNRPQGAQAIYAGSMVLFAFIMVFLLAVTVNLVVKSLSSESFVESGGTGRDIVLSMASTFGVYIISALMFGQGWSVISCMFQYMLLLPSYINTLNIFAFCNSHDVSWGTKGDNMATTSGHDSKSGVQIKKFGVDGDHASEPLLFLQPPILTQDQLSKSYNQALQVISSRPPDEVDTGPKDQTVAREDYYKNVRTWLVLAWAMSNGLLVAIFSSDRINAILTGSKSWQNGISSNPYMAVLMYAVALLAFFRFAGALAYLFLRWRRGY